MLTIKILCPLYLLFLCSLYGMSSNALANDTLYSQEKLITQVEHLYEQHSETLNYHEVVELSKKVIEQRINFPNEIVAKTYLLLATVASNNGELATAMQFTNDGLAITTQNQEITLRLQISLAKIFSAKKQYQQLLSSMQLAISTQDNKENTPCFLIALSYQSVAFAMLGEHEKALISLQRVQSAVQQNPTFSEHIFLLSILANAYYHLGDYQTALTVQLKILKLRFNLDRVYNIEQTYFHLANAYYRLNRFDDAYAAYWEAKSHAIKKGAPIYIAYASQGLALTLLSQKQYAASKAEIDKAKDLFYKNNLPISHLESLIILTKIYHAYNQVEQSFNVLLTAEKLVKNIKLSADYIILYKYLADMYLANNNLKQAYLWQKKYSDTLLESLLFSKKIIEISRSPTNEKHIIASNKARELAIKLAEQSELTTSFSNKFRKQKFFILVSTVVAAILLAYIIFLSIRQHRNKLLIEYEALEKPSYILANSQQTKQSYQTNFNMARKYNYPLTLGYISISNWQELTFQFNKKTVAEVNRGIARLLNEQLHEFETAGLINDGEYLLCFPHQKKEDVEKTLEKLVSALKLRFFANLGEFTVVIAYSIKSPEIQDIDPYIFLSKLSDSIELA